MDKFYSRSALVFKAVVAAMLGPLFVFMLSVVESDNWFAYIGISALIPAIIYAIPFAVTLQLIKKHRVNGIKKFVLYDLLSIFAPAFLGFVLTESVLIVGFGVHIGDGLISMLFLMIFVIISGVYWGLYYILSSKK